MQIKTNGQTLIEVLVTVLIIAVAAVAIVKFQYYLAYNNNLIQQKSDATILANDKMESLRNFQVLTTTSGYIAYQSIVTGSSTATVSNTTYTLNWTITTNTNPDYKMAVIVVSWTDQRSNAQSVTLVSDIAGIDPANSAAII